MSTPGRPASLRACLSDLSRHIREMAEKLGEPGEAPEAIHRLRTGVKRMRAVLKLAPRDARRELVKELDAAARAVKDAVASTRDEHVVASHLSKLAPAAVVPPSPSHVENPDYVAELAHRLEVLAHGVAEGLPEETPWGGLLRSFRRARKEFEKARAKPHDEALHELRKKIKALGYQAEFFGPEGAAAKLEKRCRKLGRLLGEHHDMVLIEDWLKRNPVVAAPPKLLAQIRSRKKRLEAQALEAAAALFKQSEEGLAKKLACSKG